MVLGALCQKLEKRAISILLINNIITMSYSHFDSVWMVLSPTMPQPQTLTSRFFQLSAELAYYEGPERVYPEELAAWPCLLMFLIRCKQKCWSWITPNSDLFQTLKFEVGNSLLAHNRDFMA